jgi:hypothetical protein
MRQQLGGATTPRERPILFSAPMVCALLAGQKTQTRRIARSDHFSEEFHARALDVGVAAAWHEMRGTEHAKATYGVPGDRLWVRETWTATGATGEQTACYRADCPIEDGIRRSGHDSTRHPAHRWRPSIHMPRWASRLTLEITSVRLERLQAITEADARAEGITECLLQEGEPGAWWTADASAGPALHGRTAVDAFRKLWNSINGERVSWEENPWVWVVAFKKLEVVR